MKIKFSVDRVEADGCITVCFDENENKYEFPSDRIGLGAGEMFSAMLDNEGLPISVEPLPEETAARKRQLYSRTAALFHRRKKQ